MAAIVAGSVIDSRHAVLVDTDEGGRIACALDGVDRHPDITVGRVLEADRDGKAAGKVAVGLAGGGTGSDGGPAHQFVDVLGDDGVEDLTPQGKPQVCQLDQELTGDLDTLLDVVGAVHVRVEDQPLPADDGAGLLEIGAHDDEHDVAHLVGELLQALRVVQRGAWVVDRAGSDHRKQAAVVALDDVVDRLSCGKDELLGRRRQRILASDFLRGSDRLDILDSDIYCHMVTGIPRSGGIWELRFPSDRRLLFLSDAY